MKCKYCNNEINNVGSLASHENRCKKNPNRISYKHSASAGAKKGCIPWNKGKKTGRPSHWDLKFSISDICVENSTYPRHCLKKRILENRLIKYKCACCGCGPEWNGNPMPLILDHINGINNDNRLKNLRFICSNCDSQLPTYKSRNRKRKGSG